MKINYKMIKDATAIEFIKAIYKMQKICFDSKCETCKYLNNNVNCLLASGSAFNWLKLLNAYIEIEPTDDD